MKSMLHEFYVSFATCMLYTSMTLSMGRLAQLLLYYETYNLPCMVSSLALPECQHATVTLSLHG